MDLLLLAALPSLFWAQPVETAPAVRRAGVARLSVPPESAAAWRAAGFEVTPLGERDRAARTRVPPPGLRARAQVASATGRPWIDANGWRFLRDPRGRFACAPPPERAALAAAEAYAFGADEVLETSPEALEEAARILGFLATVPELDLPAVADVAVVDDGSALLGEVLNLMARRNLLFEVVRNGAENAALTVRLGSKQFPRDGARNPEAFALSVRRTLSDERRSLRLYGSEVVLGRLLRDGTRARVHLLNYSGRTVEGLRVRLLGGWAPGDALVFDVGRAAVEDVARPEGATEFSLPTLGPYAVVDLAAAR